MSRRRAPAVTMMTHNSTVLTEIQKSSAAPHHTQPYLPAARACPSGCTPPYPTIPMYPMQGACPQAAPHHTQPYPCARCRGACSQKHRIPNAAGYTCGTHTETREQNKNERAQQTRTLDALTTGVFDVNGVSLTQTVTAVSEANVQTVGSFRAAVLEPCPAAPEIVAQ